MIEIIYWAFEQEGLKPATKMVLMVLAKRANWRGQCWPSRETIAREAGIVSTNTVDDHLKVLIEAGYVLVEKRHQKGERPTSLLYTLNIDLEMLSKHVKRNRKIREAPIDEVRKNCTAPEEEGEQRKNCVGAYAKTASPSDAKTAHEPSKLNNYPPTPKGEPEGHFDDLEKEEPAPSAPPPKPPSDGRVLTSRPLAPDLAARFDELLRRTEPTLVAIEKAFGPASWRVERNYRLPEDDKGRRRSLSAVALRPLEPPIGFMIETSTVLPHTVERLSRFPGLKVVVLGESDAQAPLEGVDVLVVRHIVKRAAASVNRAMVFVRAGSPQAEAWIRHGHKATLWKYYPEHRAEGWYFPSEWPPGRGPPDVRDRASTTQPAML